MNRGAEKLRRILEQRGLRQKDIATETGIDEPRVSRLLHGKSRPSRSTAQILWKRYQIDPTLWDKAARATGAAS